MQEFEGGAVEPRTDPRIFFGGGANQVLQKKLRAKTESRARSARESSAKLLRTEGRAKEKRGKGLGRGLG